MPSLIKDRDTWESYANIDAEYYVDFELPNYPSGDRIETFFRRGRDFTAKTLDRVEELLPDKDRALEIGPGVGRLTIPHARVFKEVVAVDISPTMLKNLRKNAKEENLNNIRTFLPEQDWEGCEASYAYSYLVLQHITDFEVIAEYVRKISASLKKGGIAQLQFDTRDQNILYKVRNMLPYFVLPKTQQKGVRRIRRNATDLRDVFQKNNLNIIEELKPDSTMHTFVLKKL